MKNLLSILFILLALHGISQPSESDKFLAGLKLNTNPPDGLLGSRSAFLFSSDYSEADLKKIQNAFQQTGIDAVTYVESERVMAGADLRNAYNNRFNKRDIRFLIFARKEQKEYQFTFYPFNARSNLNRRGLSAWYVHSANLQDMLLLVFRTLNSTQKRQNFLINDQPEEEEVLNIFVNTRNESLVSSLKNFKIAVPKLGDNTSDGELSQFLKENFKALVEIVDDSLLTKDLVKLKFRYVLHYVHAQGFIAKQILGYDMSKSESAIASTTYPGGSVQLKTIPSTTVIYKFYLKDLDDGNLYFGTKWDADIAWKDALKNYLDAYRVTGRLN